MLYFKKLEFPGELDQYQFETLLRKHALKQHSSLDFTFNPINIGTEKLFHGRESKNNIRFTRIKTSFEFFLPKLIINLSKEPTARFYRIRLGAIPMLVSGFFSFCILAGILSILRGRNNILEVITLIVISGFYLLLIIMELKFTTSRIRKAISTSA